MCEFWHGTGLVAVAAGTVAWLIGVLARDTSLWSDDAWVVDSTPVECGRSKETAKRSDLAGWAEYGYCASHSRYFWGLRLHMLATLHGLPVASRSPARQPTSGRACWASSPPARTRQPATPPSP